MLKTSTINHMSWVLTLVQASSKGRGPRGEEDEAFKLLKSSSRERGITRQGKRLKMKLTNLELIGKG